MWREPYLETCCRAALHRLHLCGPRGRPPGAGDEGCLRRLAAMGLCCLGGDGRFALTASGRSRHAQEILRSETRVDRG
ncbi:MAG: hypothetical protein U1E70_01520 [Acetobacteraceae bacterium]